MTLTLFVILASQRAMPDLIWFEWEKCPDGYSAETLETEFVELRDERFKNTAYPTALAPTWAREVIRDLQWISPEELGEKYVVPNSKRLLRFEPLAADNAAFLEYADCATSESAMLRFLDKYGLPYSDRYPGGIHSSARSMRRIRDGANWMQEAADSWERAKRTNQFHQFAAAFNSGDFSGNTENYEPDFVRMAELRIHLRAIQGVDLPVLSIVPNSLSEALWLQFAQAVSSNAQLRRCAVCPTWFAYGTGTGRRKSAHYCSDRCRKAAHRQRISNG